MADESEELQLPDHWSEEAKKHYMRVVQELRVQGIDDEFLESMIEAMEQFYDPDTGQFKLDNFDEFFEAMIDGLLGSDMLHDLIAASDILNEPQFKKFWLSEDEVIPCLEEWEQWLITEIRPRKDLNAADILLDESLEDERVELGDILFEHYRQAVTEELPNELYNALYEYAQTADDEEKNLAKTAMTSFNSMPGLANPMVQFVFVKSLIHHSHIPRDVARMAADDEEQLDALELIEDSLFAMLADAEEFDANYPDEEWDEDHWDDEGNKWTDDDVPF
ncbi:MAG: hypothetical protein QGG53_19480 [Planctomycetota bacterium]|jgi:hypothetical protein|nr:hypothetical protein [Planctomycetota bacterium]